MHEEDSISVSGERQYSLLVIVLIAYLHFEAIFQTATLDKQSVLTISSPEKYNPLSNSKSSLLTLKYHKNIRL